MPDLMPCDNCGSQTWGEAKYVASRLVASRLLCSECQAGARGPATAMPPTEKGKAAIAAWLRPRTSTPPAQQTLRLGPVVQPHGACHGD